VLEPAEFGDDPGHGGADDGLGQGGHEHAEHEADEDELPVTVETGELPFGGARGRRCSGAGRRTGQGVS
jgi:hypothetical protein